MSFARRMLGLMLTLLLFAVAVQAQTLRSTDDPRNLAPTVTGGTGLFTVYDAQTLRRGEFNFGFWANHYHRDPGDLAWQAYPINFQVGFSDHLEIFANFEANRVVTVGTPQLLSGFYLPDVRTKTLPAGRLVVIPLPNGTLGTSVLVGDPCGNGGFPGPCITTGSRNLGPFYIQRTGNDTGLYVRLGAPAGGILPALLPNVIPSYYPNAPFLARFSDRHTGDLWLGGKIRFTGPKNPFGFALIPLVKIPLSRDLNTALERGRGTGNYEYGVIAALDGRLHKYIHLSTNIGYIKKLDPRAEDMNLGPLCAGCGVVQKLGGGFGGAERALDIPDELRSGIGFDFPLSQYLQFIAEVSATHYVGSRTPSLLKNSPVDFVAGAKIYPGRWIAISAAYQRHLNWFSDLDTRHSPNGFIAGLSLGHYNKREEPILPNQPPTVSLELGAIAAGSADVVRDASTVCAGDKVSLRATASDPDGDTLLYSWTSTGGRIVGDSTNASFDTTGLAPGDYTVTVQVDDGCGCIAFDSKTIRVTNCPPLTVCYGPNLDVSVDKTTADAGERVAFSTTGVTGGRNYGNVNYSWTASAGTISGSGLSATLDTTGVTPGTAIEVTVKAVSDVGSCSASGSARTSLNVPKPVEKPKFSDLGQCTTFKKNAARVDNACKDVLRQVIQSLQADPQAKLVVDGFRADPETKPADLDLQRAKNVRDRLADGGLGTAIDANRITVRQGGVSTDGSQVKIYLVPSGADDPPGGTAVDAGAVTPEKKAPVRRKARRAKKG